MKRLLSLVLAFLLVTIAVPLPTMAKTEIVEKEMTLNKTARFAVTTSAKKVVWTVKGSAIKITKTASKSCRVKAVKAGKSYLYATIGKSKLRYDITVSYTEAQLKKNVSVSTSLFSGSKEEAIATFKNKSTVPVSITATAVLMDGTYELDRVPVNLYCVGANQTACEYFRNYAHKEFNKIKIEDLKVTQSTMTDVSKYVKVKTNFDDGKLNIKCTCSKDTTSVSGVLVFYAKNQHPIYLANFSLGNTTRSYYVDTDDISFYEVYINSAY